MNPLALLGWMSSGLAIAGLLYVVLAAVLVKRFTAGRRAVASAFPAVTVLKPLTGATPGLEAALETFCRQNYPGEVQLLFGAQDVADSAIAVAERLRVTHPELTVTVVVDETEHGQNRKISNLTNMISHANHEVLVLSDADIQVPADYLRLIVAELAPSGVGAVSCLYRGRALGGAWSRFCAMGIDYHFLPNAVLGSALGLARPCFGSTIAISATLLEQIGGFAAFADCLADDYEIGRAVRAAGLEVAIPPMIVTHACTEASLAELIDHEIRWARTVRRIDPVGYAGAVVTFPLPLALIGAVLLGLPPASLGLIFAILVVRIAVKFRIDAATGGGAGSWWLLPASDVLSFAIFLASFVGDTVVWQGRRFRVGRDGVLSPQQGSSN